MLLTVPGLVSVVIEPVVGVLGDVWRRRLLVLGGGVVFAAALVLAGSSGSFALLLVAFAVLDSASGAFVSLSQASLMDSEPQRREENMARWTIAGSVGALAGPALLAGAVAAGLSWRSPFLVFAAVTLVLVALAARVRFPQAAPEQRPRPRDALRALRRRDTLRWLALLELADLLGDVLLGFVALYFVDVVGERSGVGGAAIVTWTAAGLAGGFLVLRLLRRMPGTRYLRVSAVMAAVIFAAFLLLPGVAAKLGCLALLAFTTAGWYPVLQARVYAELPGQSGTALALGNVFYLPAAAIPLGLGLAAQEWGLQTALWLLLAAPAALLLLVPRHG